MTAPDLTRSPAALSAYVWQSTRCICRAKNCRQCFVVLVEPPHWKPQNEQHLAKERCKVVVYKEVLLWVKE